MLKLGALLLVAAVAASTPIPIPKPSQQTPQTPQVHSEQQTENAVGRHESANSPVAPLKNGVSNNEDAKGHEHTSEITILGVRLGEILIAFVTFLLWLATRNLVSDAKDSSERQLRAYVSATTMKLSVLGDGKTLVFHTFFKNHGQTPAHDTSDWSDVFILPFPMLKEEVLIPTATPDRLPNKFVVFPGGEHKVTHLKALDDTETNLLKTKKYGLYVMGRMTYKDTFGVDQATEYCSVIIEPELSNDVAAAKAEVPVGKSIPAGFRFTPFNNKASVKWPRKKWWHRN